MYKLPNSRLGFTLLELIVVIAIASILLGIAIPSFTSIIRSTRLTTYTNTLVAALNFARSEAIKRGHQVTVKRKGSTTGHWENGWDVFFDLTGDETFYDSNSTPCETTNGSLNEDCLLRTYDALPSGYTLITGNSTYKDYAAYSSSGLSTVPVGDTFTLCNISGTLVDQRKITINSSGRPNVGKTQGTCP